MAQVASLAIHWANVQDSRRLHVQLVDAPFHHEQANFLKDHGCPLAQGFYYGKPAPPEQFSDYWGVAERMEAKMPTEGKS